MVNHLSKLSNLFSVSYTCETVKFTWTYFSLALIDPSKSILDFFSMVYYIYLYWTPFYNTNRACTSRAYISRAYTHRICTSRAWKPRVGLESLDHWVKWRGNTDNATEFDNKTQHQMNFPSTNRGCCRPEYQNSNNI
jgi:hypothetical protein